MKLEDARLKRPVASLIWLYNYFLFSPFSAHPFSQDALMFILGVLKFHI